MILVNKNVSFIQNAELDCSWVGKAKYQILGRISTLTTALLLLAESIGRVALAALAYISASLLWGRGIDLGMDQWRKAKAACTLSSHFFVSVLFLHKVNDLLIRPVIAKKDPSPKKENPSKVESDRKIPLTGAIRETRVRTGRDLIERKLGRELFYAQLQMTQQVDGPFQYLEGDVGSVESPRKGDVAVCHYQGRRTTMEDEDLVASFHLNIGRKDYPVSLFGIFDGHGGDRTAKFLKEHLREKLEETLHEFNPEQLTNEGVWNALKMAFVRLNQELKKEKSGSTATVVLILDEKLWTANVGDSRTILVNRDQVMQLSEDAKPADPRYQKGIRNRGGNVFPAFGGTRVNGMLAVARAVGDHYLNGAMSARPKITMVPMNEIEPGSHLVLACDGIYDVASSSQVGNAILHHHRETPATLAKNIVFSAYQAGSTDNLSAMVVHLNHS